MFLENGELISVIKMFLENGECTIFSITDRPQPVYILSVSRSVSACKTSSSCFSPSLFFTLLPEGLKPV